jgi:hypothetical protein
MIKMMTKLFTKNQQSADTYLEQVEHPLQELLIGLM